LFLLLLCFGVVESTIFFGVVGVVVFVDYFVFVDVIVSSFSYIKVARFICFKNKEKEFKKKISLFITYLKKQ